MEEEEEGCVWGVCAHHISKFSLRKQCGRNTQAKVSYESQVGSIFLDRRYTIQYTSGQLGLGWEQCSSDQLSRFSGWEVDWRPRCGGKEIDSESI